MRTTTMTAIVGRALLAVGLAAVVTGPRRLAAEEGAPLKVCATLPDLGSLIEEVGGEQVSVTAFTKPTEDPHFTPARPSFIKAVNACELFVQTGLDFETAWAMLLLQNARNAAVLPGARGFLDTSAAVTPLDVPAAPIDRSMGDIHPFGNPHYLTDPLNGLHVARLIRDRLADLRPGSRAYFESRLADFERRLGAALVGESLAAAYDVEKLALLAEHGRLDDFLAAQGQADRLGGWLGALHPYAGTKVVDDHPMWPYFARRFGLVVVAHLEPKPGFPPTTKHLAEVITLMRAEGVRLVLASAYYDPRHARFVAEETGAKVLGMANLVGARPGTDTYLSTVDHNVRQVVDALRTGG